ncbi:MAG: hypothetical protein ACRD08_18920 [Acidimicrobiales bacterium]
MERDDGTADWDAACEALVAPLRPPRYLRIARAAWQTTATLVLLLVACWTVMRLSADPLSDLGRPWF